MKVKLCVWIGLASLAAVSCGQVNSVLNKVVGRTPGKVEAKSDRTADVVVEKKETKAIDNTKALEYVSNIALVLPFQLHKITPNNFSEDDIKRSALSLDFYQGFQIGLNKAVQKNGRVNLHVLDSEDNQSKSIELALSKDISESSLIVGPIYPQEIKSFGTRYNSKVLQVSPLAATMPTEFNNSNLVSVTPPISVHMQAISMLVSKSYRVQDVIIIYNPTNTDHEQFIQGFPEDIKQRLTEGGSIISISSLNSIGSYLSKNGTSHIVTGTTDRGQIKALVEYLDLKKAKARIYGHPLWDKIDFSTFSSFFGYSPTISAESHFDSKSIRVRDFQGLYKDQFYVEPTEYSYKGYDLGVYFGQLLGKYGNDYAKHLIDEPFKGLYSNYRFIYNEQWGYVNHGLNLKVFVGSNFQLL